LAKIRARGGFENLKTYMLSHEDVIYRIAEASLVAYRTGEEGWYRAFNSTDPLVQKAKLMIKEDQLTSLVQ
jgi:hypothetical protein